MTADAYVWFDWDSYRWLDALRLNHREDDMDWWNILHQHIAPQNLFINPDTDSILLFDFNAAARVGETPGSNSTRKRISPNFEEPELYDIKGVGSPPLLGHHPRSRVPGVHPVRPRVSVHC